ncbi:MAG: FG-GAP repeat protein [Spirosomataceae bacterium]
MEPNNWGLIKKIINGAGTNTADQLFISINTGNFDLFGFSIGLSNNTLVVGARFDDQGGGDRGAVYVFGKDTGGIDNWGLVKKVVNQRCWY